MRFSLHTRKQRIVAGAAGAAILALSATGAYAFFTGSQLDGTASTAVASSVRIVSVTGPTGLVPGGPAKQVSVLVTNDTTDPLHVNGVHLSVTAFSKKDVDPAQAPCTAADFAVADVTPNEDIPGTESRTYLPLLALRETGVNQDNCRNVTVPLHVTTD